MCQEQMSMSQTNIGLFQSAFPQRDKGSAIALMLLSFVTGVVVLWQANTYRVSLQTTRADTGTTCSNTALWLTRILMVIGILLFVAPLIVIGVSMTGNYGRYPALRALEEQFKAQIMGIVSGVVILALVFWLNSEMKKCNKSVGTTMWAVVIIFIVGCIGLLGFRYYSDKQAIANAPRTLYGDIASSRPAKAYMSALNYLGIGISPEQQKLNEQRKLMQQI